MDKEQEILIKVQTVEKSIDFWNKEFDKWHHKLESASDEKEAEESAQRIWQCWKRMDIEKETASSLDKEISEIISKNS